MRVVTVVMLLSLLAGLAYGQSPEDIVGAWLWQSTSYSDGTVETPSSVGYSIQLQFSSDMSFLRYRNGALIEEGDWGISYVWVEINGGLVHVEMIETTSGDLWEPLMVVPEALLEMNNRSGGTELYVYTGVVSDKTVSWGSIKVLFRD